jgi:hypothetical protein
MTTQLQTPITPLYSLEFVVLEETQPEQPAQYSAYDFGYELDPDEVGKWMAAEYSNGSFDGPAQPEDADEFESLNRWFIS